MALEWIKERTPTWDPDKARIVGAAPAGVFDARYRTLREGGLVPGTWWRVQDAGVTVGYGWLDVVWGDAEILLAVEPGAQGRGVGAFVLERLADEARRLGLHRLYNIVRPTHPEGPKVTAFLVARGFTVSEDGSLSRNVR
jgi:GNAT superfamily N-acetyltransferase